MYKNHQPAIMKFAKQSPENTARVIKFVLMTIQRQFSQVHDIMTGAKQVNTTEMTKRGIAYAWDNRVDLHAALHGAGSDREKMLAVLAVPGLGIPKAGFVLQLACGRVGCMDSHNMRKFALSPKDFRSKGSVNAISKRIDAYINVCQKVGGCEYLWDQWCEMIAEKYPTKFSNADHVSWLHFSAIVG